MAIEQTREEFKKAYQKYSDRYDVLEGQVEDLAEKIVGNDPEGYSKQISKLENEIEKIEDVQDQLTYLEMTNENVYAALEGIKGVDSIYENEECFIVVPVGKKVKSGTVNAENFIEYFGEDLKSIKGEIQGEVFKTANSVGVFAKINNEDVVITINQHAPVSELCIVISGVNEDGLTVEDVLKKKAAKIR